jgi:hypothetical protein
MSMIMAMITARSSTGSGLFESRSVQPLVREVGVGDLKVREMVMGKQAMST